jgi:hypothetical protein
LLGLGPLTPRICATSPMVFCDFYRCERVETLSDIIITI